MQAATPNAGTDARLSRMEGVVEQMGAQLAALDSRLSRVEGTVEQMGARLTSVEQRLATVERRLDWIIGLIFTSWLSIVGLILWKLG